MCFNPCKDRESCCNHCVAPVKLIKASIGAENVRYSRFNHYGCTVKATQGSFNPGKDRESSCNHCGGPVKLVEAGLSVGKVRYSRFNHHGGHVRAV